ncbi:uncharacterized protein LOC109597728 [Aethina tumida]|uniref:uncharacterized protein LOC109597728 n=1 Tax=Aethina tumida TaxID=116153 RepID=UPI00214961A7|nr:uncharacterized protein LOC109597728 [Aethina tumida]
MKRFKHFLVFTIVITASICVASETTPQPNQLEELINTTAPDIGNVTYVNSKNVSGNLKITTLEILTTEQSLAERQTTEPTTPEVHEILLSERHSAAFVPVSEHTPGSVDESEPSNVEGIVSATDDINKESVHDKQYWNAENDAIDAKESDKGSNFIKSDDVIEDDKVYGQALHNVKQIAEMIESGVESLYDNSEQSKNHVSSHDKELIREVIAALEHIGEEQITFDIEKAQEQILQIGDNNDTLGDEKVTTAVPASEPEEFTTTTNEQKQMFVSGDSVIPNETTETVTVIVTSYNTESANASEDSTTPIVVDESIESTTVSESEAGLEITEINQAVTNPSTETSKDAQQIVNFESTESITNISSTIENSITEDNAISSDQTENYSNLESYSTTIFKEPHQTETVTTDKTTQDSITTFSTTVSDLIVSETTTVKSVESAIKVDSSETSDTLMGTETVTTEKTIQDSVTTIQPTISFETTTNEEPGQNTLNVAVSEAADILNWTETVTTEKTTQNLVTTVQTTVSDLNSFETSTAKENDLGTINVDASQTVDILNSTESITTDETTQDSVSVMQTTVSDLNSSDQKITNVDASTTLDVLDLTVSTEETIQDLVTTISDLNSFEITTTEELGQNTLNVDVSEVADILNLIENVTTEKTTQNLVTTIQTTVSDLNSFETSTAKENDLGAINIDASQTVNILNLTETVTTDDTTQDSVSVMKTAMSDLNSSDQKTTDVDASKTLDVLDLTVTTEKTIQDLVTTISDLNSFETTTMEELDQSPLNVDVSDAADILNWTETVTTEKTTQNLVTTIQTTVSDLNSFETSTAEENDLGAINVDASQTMDILNSTESITTDETTQDSVSIMQTTVSVLNSSDQKTTDVEASETLDILDLTVTTEETIQDLVTTISNLNSFETTTMEELDQNTLNVDVSEAADILSWSETAAKENDETTQDSISMMETTVSNLNSSDQKTTDGDASETLDLIVTTEETIQDSVTTIHTTLSDENSFETTVSDLISSESSETTENIIAGESIQDSVTLNPITILEVNSSELTTITEPVEETVNVDNSGSLDILNSIHLNVSDEEHIESVTNSIEPTSEELRKEEVNTGSDLGIPDDLPNPHESTIINEDFLKPVTPFIQELHVTETSTYKVTTNFETTELSHELQFHTENANQSPLLNFIEENFVKQKSVLTNEGESVQNNLESQLETEKTEESSDVKEGMNPSDFKTVVPLVDDNEVTFGASTTSTEPSPLIKFIRENIKQQQTLTIGEEANNSQEHTNSESILINPELFNNMVQGNFQIVNVQYEEEETTTQSAEEDESEKEDIVTTQSILLIPTTESSSEIVEVVTAIYVSPTEFDDASTEPSNSVTIYENRFIMNSDEDKLAANSQTTTKETRSESTTSVTIEETTENGNLPNTNADNVINVNAALELEADLNKQTVTNDVSSSEEAVENSIMPEINEELSDEVSSEEDLSGYSTEISVVEIIDGKRVETPLGNSLKNRKLLDVQNDAPIDEDSTTELDEKIEELSDIFKTEETFDMRINYSHIDKVYDYLNPKIIDSVSQTTDEEMVTSREDFEGISLYEEMELKNDLEEETSPQSLFVEHRTTDDADAEVLDNFENSKSTEIGNEAETEAPTTVNNLKENIIEEGTVSSIDILPTEVTSAETEPNLIQSTVSTINVDQFKEVLIDSGKTVGDKVNVLFNQIMKNNYTFPTEDILDADEERDEASVEVNSNEFEQEVKKEIIKADTNHPGSTVENISKIKGTILGNDVELTVQITEKDEQFYLPENSEIKIVDNTFVIVWKGSDNRNNSIKLSIKQQEDEYILEEVQFVSERGDEIITEVSTNVVLNDNTKKVVTFPSGKQVEFSDLSFLKGVLQVKDADIQAKISTQKMYLQIEIVVVCLTLGFLVAISMFIVLKRYKDKLDSGTKNTETV